jgi:hypothetical protein
MVLTETELPVELHKGVVTLVCASCTRTRTFGVNDIETTKKTIEAAGWKRRADRTLCPRCP